MLWIHIGNDGVLDCKVNVGNRIRQGDGFDVFLSTENNGIATYEVEGLGYVKPGSDEVSNLNVTVEKSSQTFYLGSPSQANAFFRNGVEYDGYLGSIPSDATTFYANGGHIQLLIYISKDGGVTQHAENATIFVEPTYGKHYMGISCNDYEYLMEILGKHESDISNKLDKTTLFNQSVASFVNFENGIGVEKINNGYPIVTDGNSEKIAMRAFTSADSKVASGTIRINTLNFDNTNFAKFQWSLNRAKGSGEKSLEAWFTANGSSEKFYLAQRGEVEAEAEARKEADTNLQSQIDAINQSQNFVATVATYSDLLTYDTTKLQDGDCILVLRDGTHSNSPYVYKWVTGKGFAPVGEVGDSYTKAQSDGRYVAKDSTAASYKRVYGVNEDGVQGVEAYSKEAVGNLLVQRDDKGQVYLPNQSTAAPDADQAISRRYFEANAIRNGVANNLSEGTLLSFPIDTISKLKFNLQKEGLSYTKGSDTVFSISRFGFGYKEGDADRKIASWEEMVDGALNSKIISNYAKTETDAVTTHNASLAKEDGKRNFYKFTVGAASGFNVSMLTEEGWPAFDLERTESTGRTLLGLGGGTAQDLAEGIIGIDRYGDDGDFYFKIQSKQKELSLYADNKITLHSTDKMTFIADDSDFDFEGNGINLTGDRLTLNNKEWGIFPVFFDGAKEGFVLTDVIIFSESLRRLDFYGLVFLNDAFGHVYTTPFEGIAVIFADSQSTFSEMDGLRLYGTDATNFLDELLALDDRTIANNSITTTMLLDGAVTLDKLNQDLSHLLSRLQTGNGTGSIGMMKEPGKTVNFAGKNANAVAFDATLGTAMSVEASGNYSSIWGGASRAEGKRAFSQGTNTLAKGNYSHSEGDNSVAYGIETHAEGYATLAIGLGSHTEGNQTQTKTVKYVVPSGGGGGSGQGGAESGSTGDDWDIEAHRGEFSHAEGLNTIASGYVSHAEGTGSVADGHVSHAEGESTLASGRGAKSFGYRTVASGDYSVAGGYASKATAQNAFALGDNNHAEGMNSVAFGNGNQVNAANGFATGFANIVYGENDAKNGVSIGEGLYSYNGCVALGKYNVRDDTKARNNVLEIGAGDSDVSRRNAMWVDSSGHAFLLYQPFESHGIATKGYVDQVVPSNLMKILKASTLDPSRFKEIYTFAETDSVTKQGCYTQKDYQGMDFGFPLGKVPKSIFIRFNMNSHSSETLDGYIFIDFGFNIDGQFDLINSKIQFISSSASIDFSIQDFCIVDSCNLFGADQEQSIINDLSVEFDDLLQSNLTDAQKAIVNDFIDALKNNGLTATSILLELNDFCGGFQV